MSFSVVGFKPNEGQPMTRVIEPEQTVRSMLVAPFLEKGDTVDASLLLVLKNDDVIVNGTAKTDTDSGEDGDGSETAFGFTAAEAPIVPGSLVVHALAASDDHVMNLTDNGDGTFTDENGDVVGSVDYFTGVVAVVFPEAVKNADNILYDNRKTTAVPLNGAVTIVPKTETDNILPQIPYWGEAEILGYTNLAKKVAVSTDLVSYASIQSA